MGADNKALLVLAIRVAELLRIEASSSSIADPRAAKAFRSWLGIAERKAGGVGPKIIDEAKMSGVD
jgi:hypothetical protein